MNIENNPRSNTFSYDYAGLSYYQFIFARFALFDSFLYLYLVITSTIGFLFFNLKPSGFPFTSVYLFVSFDLLFEGSWASAQISTQEA